MQWLADTALILWLQRFSPQLDLPFGLITMLGNESFFLVFLPVFYWCLDRRRGAGVALLFLLSATLNAIAKAMFGMPRPFLVDSAVMPLVSVHSNGFPSGHTQNAVVIWLYLAVRLKKVWLWWLAGALVVLIPLSRLYLGVHFPIDLVGGYLLGGVLLVLFVIGERPGAAMIAARTTATLMTVLMVTAAVAVVWAPTLGNYAISAVATLLGAAIGMVMERRWIQFSVPSRWGDRVRCGLVGFCGLVIIYLGLKFAFTAREPAGLLRFLRYGLVGLWVAGGAPWLCTRLARQ